MSNEIQISGPRLPYVKGVEERFGIDKGGWKALVEAVFPHAQESGAVVLALSYCKARNLDPFKRCVHIVPIWDGKKKKMVDTVWAGIGELRTTAFRTKQYAGRDATVYGPDETKTWHTDKGDIKVTFPVYAQVTVYRLIEGHRVAFAGPPVYWEEAYVSTQNGAPNSMWRKRPRGQLDKCSESAALRCAFPEELGDDLTEVDGPTIMQHTDPPETYESVKEEAEAETEQEMGTETITEFEPRESQEPVEPQEDDTPGFMRD